MLSDSSSDVRIAAITALGWIGPAARESIPKLITLISDSSLSERAVEALTRIGPEVVGPLEAASQNPEGEQLRTIVAQLAGQFHQNGPTLHLVGRGGKKENVLVNDHTIVVAVATWCPYSKRLREFLERDDVKPYFSGLDIYFIFEDETEAVKAHVLKEHPDLTSEETKRLSMALAKIRRTGFYDTSFLVSLPGRTFQVVNLHQLSVEGFPTVLSPDVSLDSLPKDAPSWLGVSGWVNSKWFSNHINMPPDLLREFRSISGQSLI